LDQELIVESGQGHFQIVIIVEVDEREPRLRLKEIRDQSKVRPRKRGATRERHNNLIYHISQIRRHLLEVIPNPRVSMLSVFAQLRLDVYRARPDQLSEIG